MPTELKAKLVTDWQQSSSGKCMALPRKPCVAKVPSAVRAILVAHCICEMHTTTPRVVVAIAFYQAFACLRVWPARLHVCTWGAGCFTFIRVSTPSHHPLCSLCWSINRLSVTPLASWPVWCCLWACRSWVTFTPTPLPSHGSLPTARVICRYVIYRVISVGTCMRCTCIDWHMGLT